MRGHPDIGNIENFNQVVPHDGGYRGVLTIQGDGTRHTPKRASWLEAQSDLAELNARILPKGNGTGISKALQADIDAAVAAL